MAWGTPIIHATGDVVSASDWNTGSNDLTFLSGPLGNAVQTSESTATTTYTDLTTIGPAVTLITGTTAQVQVGASAVNNTAGDSAAMAFAVSGATVVAASDNNAASVQGTNSVNCSTESYITGLTAGSNTFTAKYRAVTGGTATFARRWINVRPLP